MSLDARLCAFSVLLLTASVARPVESQTPQNLASPTPAQAQVSRLFAGIFSDTSVHMRMGPTRPATAADSARAAAAVVRARAALSQYTDVKVAERDGYYRNMPWMEEQPIYHYNNLHNVNSGGFDITKPVSLLYQKDDRGQLKLVGAMYGASGGATPDELDALLPIGMAHWHEHVNLCYPRGDVLGNTSPQVDGRLAFLLELYFSATTEAQCEHLRGSFVPLDGGGWMTHVYMFADSDDPKVIWDSDDAGLMMGPMRHPH